MRATGPLASLLGSLGLHACAVLVLLFAARVPVPHAPTPDERLDAWRGDSTVEVDAIAEPGAQPNIANTASGEQPSEASEPVAPAAPSPPVAAPGDEPALKPKPKPKPRPKPASESAASTPGAGQHEASTPASTGSFGSADLPPGVRSLPSAFTRAIPPATGADPIWQSLPAGKLAPFTLAVRVDAEGHIGGTQLLNAHDGSALPEYVEHVRTRVIGLLGGGLFALQNNGTSGSDLFRITITLSDRAVKEDSGPAELVERGFEPPRAGAPGRAYFTLASGRHFDAKVEVLGAPSGK